ncbi:PREDICTED: serine/threonine-protein kinase 19-like [Priapulus caudatus]|uniref:Serine/threonine-protein kinase 19-like n=1 Tax=Priapulus caudatus TaxID=37621 RepID=A0ABM1E6D5_PRICU|nr:PREDICTED: serine/threonine-protein kinase 19-like [Priapulus caudatus]XP_014667757.1 PREDICTED: serine/threonine-protein kinase 19-like [Priapulus caudatus]
MNRKRTLPDVYRHRKKICGGRGVSDVQGPNEENETEVRPEPARDAQASLQYLHNLFPIDKFEGRLPPIILRHQLYSLSPNRTELDQQLNDIIKKGEVRLFKLGTIPDEFALVFTEEYREHVRKFTSRLWDVPKTTIDKFLDLAIGSCLDVSLTRDDMINELGFQENEIKDLFKAGLLAVRDVGSWWLSVPGAGTFMKSHLRGRKAILLMIRKCKYKEILQKELEARKLPKAAKLGISYHIHDVIGADLVSCIDTTSGKLLRLNE